MSVYDDPFALDRSLFEIRTGFAITSPLAHAKILPITDGRDLVLVDPATRWARSWRAFVRQLRDIVVHEFWMGQGRRERSPGWS